MDINFAEISSRIGQKEKCENLQIEEELSSFSRLKNF